MRFNTKQIRLAVDSDSWLRGIVAEPHYTEKDLDNCLTQSSVAGFAGTMISSTWLQSYTSYKNKKLESVKPEIAAGYWQGKLLTNATSAEKERITKTLEQLHTAGTKFLAYVEDLDEERANTPVAQRKTLEPKEFDDYCHRLSQLSRFTKKFGLKLCYWPFLGNVIQNPNEIDAMLKKNCY